MRALLMSVVLSLAALAPAQRQAFLASLTAHEALALQHTWAYWARAEQLPPTGGEWGKWALIAGRGFGKTRVGAEQVHSWARELGKGGRIAFVGKDPADIRKTMIEGESGLLACAPPWGRPEFKPSKREIYWPNGCVGFTYSAEVPDDLRGPQHHKFWADELCKWKRPQETWDNLEMGLRLGDHPQGVITTTPRPIATLKEILSDPETVVTRGSTFDNAANLPQRFLNTLIRKYAGTRLGRQELNAEVLADTPGALWTLKMIEACRVRHRPERFVRVGVAIDPPGSDDQDEDAEDHAEAGIVAGGVGWDDGLPYILEDASDSLSPGDWGKRAVQLYQKYEADFIIAEANNGGAMVEHVVKVAARELDTHVNIRIVHASRGKQTRAEPVAALYEQKRARHIGAFPDLEDQMSTWVPGKKSPDRMDALVWLVTALVLEGPDDAPAGVLDIGSGQKSHFTLKTEL